MSIKLTDNQKELVESFGVVQEHMGLSPAASRVNALLTISDVIELSFDEIRETLQLSKSATSNAINSLLTMDRIDYKTKPGDRKRYFYSKLGQWQTSFRKDIQGLKGYNDIMKLILENRTPETKLFNNQLENLTEFMEYFMSESIKIIDNWEKK